MMKLLRKGSSKVMKQLHSSFNIDSTTKTATINMSNFRPKMSLVFSGRPEGLKVRTEINLEVAESQLTKIIVDIPSDTIAFNPSFFLGMFGKSIIKMGKDAFILFYEFKCSDHIKKNISENIDYALKVSNPLVN